MLFNAALNINTTDLREVADTIKKKQKKTTYSLMPDNKGVEKKKVHDR